MMRVLVVLFWILAAPVFAQTASVRGGEHARFTRLVISMPVGTPWRIGRIDGGYGIRLFGVSQIEMSDLFARVPRNRLRDATSATRPDQLDLAVDCTCNIAAFQWQPDKLVVDLSDGPAEPNSIFETQLDIAPAPIEERRDDEVAVPVVLQPQPVIVESNTFQDLMPNPFLGSTLSSEVSTLEAEVIYSIARAASQGLLEPSVSIPDEGHSGNDSEDRNHLLDRNVVAEEDHIAEEPSTNNEPRGFVSTETRLAEQIQAMTAPGVFSQTSIDRDIGRIGFPSTVTQAGESCLSNDFFDFDSWGDERGFSEQIAELRSAVTGEFDRVVPGSVERLARGYLYFGFGREAIQTLQIDETMSQDRMIIRILSEIIDDTPVETDLLTRQVGCDAPVALWAFLAHGEGALDADIDRNAVLKAFKALPEGLQIHLGPRLSEKFLKLGDVDSAERALSTRVIDELQSSEQSLAETQLLQHQGQATAAAAELSELADNDARISAEALVELIELNIDQGLPITDGQLALLSAAQFEHKDSAVAVALSIAHIEGLIYLTRLDEAFAMLDEESSIIGRPLSTKLHNAIVSKAVQVFDDTAFLDLAFDENVSDLEANTENDIAARLIDLGFGKRADEVLAISTLGSEMGERRYLRAQAALLLGEPMQAEAYLAGIMTPRADALRGEARAQMGDYSAVLQAGISAGDVEATTLAAFRSGDWQRLSQSQDDALGTASLVVLSEPAVPQDSAAQLANGRELLAESEEMRSAMTGLLNRFSAPSDLDDQ